ncbi:MAG: hypothetical protein AMJ54_13280 [Deltaproteobacteria bacterium SG8_13]|nr:MAG: hypothetical protein AMJ54_13280 [Deltaproteobacteria bacterium SG8_13]
MKRGTEIQPARLRCCKEVLTRQLDERQAAGERTVIALFPRRLLRRRPGGHCPDRDSGAEAALMIRSRESL